MEFFLTSRFFDSQSKRPTITMPPNQIEVKLKFARRRSAKVMGKLADRETEPKEGERVRGILVTQNFHSKIVAPGDLAAFTPLRVGSISSKLHIPFAGSLDTLKLFLHEMFAGVKELSQKGDGDNADCSVFTLHGGKVRVASYFCLFIRVYGAFLIINFNLLNRLMSLRVKEKVL